MLHTSRKTRFLLLAALFAASCGGNAGPPVPDPGNTSPKPGQPGNPKVEPGQTEFTTDEGGQGSKGGRGAETAAPGMAPTPGPAANPTAPPSDAVGAPGGRVANVQEGDIYKVDGNRLFYLNTYRGFLIYDLTDPKKPERVARLPVFGYPIEMYVANNTVFALLRDALYLTQVNGQPQFERHNVSQLVTIDITDLRNPKVLKTIDIVGHLREGVSRKLDDTIYVVSYIPQSYSWGWRPNPEQRKEQAWVYSFNVANPGDVTKVGEHKIFEGGSQSVHDNQGNSYDRSFSEVYISATSNALMVAENWHVYSSSYPGSPVGPRGGACGTYNSTQQVHVSIIDISDTEGHIRPHVDFWTAGVITDQFKMTYAFDAATKAGTFFGILGKQAWSSAGCQGTQIIKNTLESWDVSVAGKPVLLDALDFGKTRETVRGSAFDLDRKVAYAITAQQIDPLYALDLSNPRDLRIRSAIDGLSGDMTVFRLVGDKQFLLGVGRDTSDTCTGFQDTDGWRSAKIAVSLIDVKNLDAIRLVQRQCVAVKNADWIGSDVTQNLDQAHKMLGMHADGTLNVLTVPVYYSKRVEPADRGDWWWYRWETAVGLMSWDLSRYDVTKSHTMQNVIQNHGSFVHPHGEVRRSIVFTHEAATMSGVTKRRMMINLSDTHVSVADLSDLTTPTGQATIEIAPFYNQIYRFGEYLVEQVQAKPQSWGSPSQDVMTFRVKKAGGNVDEAPIVHSFDIGQIFRVLKHNDSLVLFRRIEGREVNKVYTPPMTEALVVDLRNPATPRLAGRVTVPTLYVPYYRYWCGMGAYWGGFWFDQETNFASTTTGLAFYTAEWRHENNQSIQTNKLIFLDLTNVDAPKVSEELLPATLEWGSFGVVADPVDPRGFYITHRKKLEEVKSPEGAIFTRYKYFAQRWEPAVGKWAAVHDINTPGRLVRTYANAAGERMFLSQDTTYRWTMEGMSRVWFADYRLALLRQVTVGGKPAAELLGTHNLTDLYPSALLVDNGKLLMNARPQKNYYYGFGYPGDVATSPGIGSAPAVPGGSATSPVAPLPPWETTSDRLIIFDLSQNRLVVAYDKATRMYNVQLMGTHENKLFVNLMGAGNHSYYDRGAVGGGDGILVIDVSNAAAPKGIRFLRTLGYASHIEFFGNDVYVAAGHFGLNHMSLADAPSLPDEPIM